MTLKSHKYFSKIGLILVLAYFLITAICLVMFFSTNDPKGRYMFLHLPIVLQMAMVSTLGLDEPLRSINWFCAYIIFWLPAIIFLYFISWTLSQIVKSLSKWKI